MKWTQESARVAREGRAQARRWVGSYRWTDGRGVGGVGVGWGEGWRGVGVCVWWWRAIFSIVPKITPRSW